jgi:hypothetical protein
MTTYAEKNYELGSLIHTLLRLAAGEYIGYGEDSDEDDYEAACAAYDAAHDAAWDLRLTKLQLARLCAEAVDNIGINDCVWCGVDTSEIGEYYMVPDEIWERYGPTADGCPCIGCLEGQMGRQLVAADFTDCPVNHEKKTFGSPRLRDRLSA